MTTVIGVTHHLVDGCGTEALTGISVLFRTASSAHLRIKHMQMHRLIFIMRDGGVVDVCYFVEGERAVKPKVSVSLGRTVPVITVDGELLHRFVARFLMVTIKNSPGPPTSHVLQTGVSHSQPTTMPKPCMKISILAQLWGNPTIFDTKLV